VRNEDNRIRPRGAGARFHAPGGRRARAIERLCARERREIIGLIVEVAAIVGALILLVVLLAHTGC